MYILNPKRFEEALRQRGFKSIGALARTLGIHRNTIHYYLSGHGVFPEKLERILDQLSLDPADVLIRKKGAADPLAAIAPLMDRLQQQFPDAAFVLFGSRARKTARPYSDWDIGVYCQTGLTHERYREILREKEDWVEGSSYLVDVVNLNRADRDFLESICGGWTFLGGNLGSWLELQKKAIHEKAE